MPVFQSLFHFLTRPNVRKKTVLRYRADARIAAFAAPLFEKLLANDQDGITYRGSIAHWHLAERPPIAQYLGLNSQCRIDGPLQDSPANYQLGSYVPIGGQLMTSDFVAHLSPFEADALRRRLMHAVDREIADWTEEHKLYELPRFPVAIDRPSADRAAKALIANWTPENQRESFGANAMQGGPDHG